MYTVYIISCEGKGSFDVSSLAHDMTYTSSLMGQPGKLTMTLEKDPNGILTMTVGDKVLFLDEDGSRVFSGKIFTLGTDRSDSYSVTAYDQMRYLQNHDYINLDGEENKSLQDIFVKICTQGGFTYQIKTPCMEPLEPHLFIDQSYFEILQYCIEQTNLKTNRQYFVRDRGGILELNEITANFGKVDNSPNIPQMPSLNVEGPLGDFMGSPLIIGDGSLLTDYRYEVDIDKETCTEVYLMESIKNSSVNSDKEKTDKKLVYAQISADKAAKWGRLRKIINIKEQQSEEKLKEYAMLELEVYAKSSKTMRLEALGYPLYAGDGFKLMLDKLGLNISMYVMAVTHTYGDIHTMSLDVSTGEFLPEAF